MVGESSMEDAGPSRSEGMKYAWKEAATSHVIAGRTCAERVMQRGMDRKRQALKRRERDEWKRWSGVTVRQRGGGTSDFIVRLWLLMMDLRRRQELMTCEGAAIAFICSSIAFVSASLGNYVFLNLLKLFFGHCLHFDLFYIPKGMVSICPLRYSRLDIDHHVP